jgi:hypothetical protein
VPRIEKIYKSDLLTIVYFKFLNLQPFPKSELEKVFIELSHLLYLISLDGDAINAFSELPYATKDFKNDPRYIKNISQIKSSLLKEGIKAKEIENGMGAAKPVITHGSLHEYNVFKKATLVDWDHFGIYPLGFDVAHIYHRLIVIDAIEEFNISDWLERYYRDTILNEDWKDFQRNFLYYLLLFYFNYKIFEKENGEDLKEQIISNLESVVV